MPSVQERLQIVCEENREWATRNFGSNPVKAGWRDLQEGTVIDFLGPLMGIGEENGELGRAILNHDLDEVKDSLGDILVFLCNFSNMVGIEIKLPGENPLHGRWTTSLAYHCVLTGEIGYLFQACLKRCQGIRGYEESSKFTKEVESSLTKIWQAVDVLCIFLTQINAIDILESVWTEVKQRDWIKNNKTGD